MFKKSHSKIFLVSILLIFISSTVYFLSLRVDVTDSSIKKTEEVLKEREPIGLKYSILVRKGRGEEKYSLGKEPYSSRDLFKLVVEPSQEGYLYVLREDTKKNLLLLFPSPDVDASRALVKRSSISIPNDWLSFEKKPGRDRIIFITSTKPLGIFGGLPADLLDKPLAVKVLDWIKENATKASLYQDDTTSMLIQAKGNLLIVEIFLDHK
ncbi:MAG: DUF4384 domain-containing protein [Blastocatellia bacterium]|nr:DUF4384 domain-containing protein [Blastocatellia bacterium]